MTRSTSTISECDRARYCLFPSGSPFARRPVQSGTSVRFRLLRHIQYGGGLSTSSSTYELESQEVYVADSTQTRQIGSIIQRWAEVNSYAAFAETIVKVTPIDPHYHRRALYARKEEFPRIKPAVPLNEDRPYFCPNPASTYAPCANPVLKFTRFTPRVSIDQQLADDTWYMVRGRAASVRVAGTGVPAPRPIP